MLKFNTKKQKLTKLKADSLGNKIDKLLAKVTKRKREKKQITNIDKLYILKTISNILLFFKSLTSIFKFFSKSTIL